MTMMSTTTTTMTTTRVRNARVSVNTRGARVRANAGA